MSDEGSSALGAAISSVLDFTGNSIMANSANAKSKRNTWLQLWQNKYLMDLQNEYNLPKNQMKRLRDAGLNPNLVYGNGATTLSADSGNVSPANVTPASGSFGIISKMQALNSIKQQDANIEQTKASTDAIDANIRIKEKQLQMQEDFNLARIALLLAQTKSIPIMNAKRQAELEYLLNKFDWKNPNDWVKGAKTLREAIGPIIEEMKGSDLNGL